MILVGTLCIVVVSFAYQSLRPEEGYRRVLSYALYRQPCDEPPVLDKPTDFVVDLYGLKYKGRTDNLIDFRIILFGAFEKPILYFMRDVLLASGDRGVFVDVGANTGQHSLFMSKFATEVHAFEPYPPVLNRFYENIALNGISNIHVHALGLSDVALTAPFFEPNARNLGTGSFLREFGHGNTKETDLKLELVVGDEVFRDFAIGRVALMKLDIEGYERHALNGLRKTIARDRPIIVVELTVDPRIDETFHSYNELLNVFPTDYNLLMFDSNAMDEGLGHYKLSALDIDFRFKSQYEVVAYPAEKEGRIPLSNPD